MFLYSLRVSAVTSPELNSNNGLTVQWCDLFSTYAHNVPLSKRYKSYSLSGVLYFLKYKNFRNIFWPRNHGVNRILLPSVAVHVCTMYNATFHTHTECLVSCMWLCLHVSISLVCAWESSICARLAL